MRFIRSTVALLALSFSASLSAFSQSGPQPSNAQSSVVRVQIKDPSGAGLQATGVLVGPSSQQKRPFQTNALGFWNLSGLARGTYRLEISRSGFTTQTLKLEVPASGAVSREIVLPLEVVASSITVVSAVPIGKADLSLSDIPVGVQTLTAKQMEDSGALDLADAMNKRLNGVYINENQGNPYQPDINYRGYTASPLLGTPQGLSVYMDGVRQNQPFGDVVAWDLIPKVAIASAELMPGANPVYGLNTLGGAIAIQTKSGLTHPGARLQITGGSFGRRAIEGEIGGSAPRGLNWYVAGNLYHEDGWRKRSPSDVRQSFAKLGWTHGKTTLALSGAYAANWLNGNGTQDFRALQRDYTSVYTVPDTTWNRSPSLTFNATHDLSDKISLSGNAYFRYVRGDTTNGDINEDSFDQSLYNLSASEIAALTAAGYTGFPTTGNSTTQPFPFWRCIAQGLQKNEPSEKCTGVITNTRTQQNNYGLSGLVSWRTSHNRLSAGVGWDRSSLTYRQASQFGYLSADGISITPINSFLDGSTNADDTPVDTRVQLHGTVNTPSIYAMDLVSLGKWTVTVSGRYNRTAVDNFDRLPKSAGRGSLNGNYVFQRFNPSAGFTYSPTGWLTTYFDYSESSRAPTSIELGCADPNFPCNLPNALVSDPPLDQVVSRSFEVGVRSKQEGILRWSADWFRGQNSNDLLFIASNQTGFGYFANFGKTRRQGAELNLSATTRHFGVGGGYTFLRATYESPQTVNGGSNSSNDSSKGGLKGVDDDIEITPGNRIPQTPQHILKVFADYKPSSKLTVDVNVLAISSSFARGNENNQNVPDGTYYLGSGKSPAYGIVNLGGHYQLHPRFQLFLQINNLFDRQYYTAAQLGATPYDNNGRFTPRPFAPVNGDYPLRHTTFYAPGAPIAVIGGLRVTLWKK